jgi:hypothetical protein
MKPDRSNYELWFTDWLDGRLDEKEARDLEVFLSRNPDLREELDGLAFTYLEPGRIVYKTKKSLEKSVKNYSESQFEHLCIASLENDLTTAQKDELKEIIDQDKTKRKVFELYQNLKLKPSSAIFKRKSIVKKITAGIRILKWSVIGLSAAATVAVIITAYLFIAPNLMKTAPQQVKAAKHDTLLIEHPAPVLLSEVIAPDKRSSRKETGKSLTEADEFEADDSYAGKQEITLPDIDQSIDRSDIQLALKVPAPVEMIPELRENENSLMEYHPDNIPVFTDERTHSQRFLAKIFHERIMRDTTAGNRPVKPYDIAVAGINGLNKFFGWDMSLQKKTDRKGDIKSYSFNSRLLKINAPAKKLTSSL